MIDRQIVASRPTKPGARRLVRDLPGLLRRLIETDATVISLAREYGLSRMSAWRYLRAAATEQQWEVVRAKVRRQRVALLAAAGGRYKRVPVGTVVVRGGRRWVKFSAAGRGIENWMHLARWRWELAYGRLPAGQLLWYRDGDPLHDELANLEAVTYAEKLRRLRASHAEAFGPVRAAGVLAAKRRAAADARALRAAKEKSAPEPREAAPTPREEPAAPRERARRNVADFLKSLERVA